MTPEERIKSMTKKQRIEHAIGNALRECDSVFKENGKVISVCKITSPQPKLVAGYDLDGNKLDDSCLELCSYAMFEGTANLTVELGNHESIECHKKISSTFTDVKYNDGKFTGQISKNVSVM